MRTGFLRQSICAFAPVGRDKTAIAALPMTPLITDVQYYPYRVCQSSKQFSDPTGYRESLEICKRDTAIDSKRLRGHEAALIARKEANNLRNVIDRSKST